VEFAENVTFGAGVDPPLPAPPPVPLPPVPPPEVPPPPLPVPTVEPVVPLAAPEDEPLPPQPARTSTAATTKTQWDNPDPRIEVINLARTYCRRARQEPAWRRPKPDSSANRLKISMEPPPLPEVPGEEFDAAAAGDDWEATAVTATVTEFCDEPPLPVHVSM
jgi:hypothetical protein